MHHNLNKETPFDLSKMITINLLRERETRQSFFDFEGEDFEGIDFERLYTEAVAEQEIERLKEKGEDFSLHTDTKIDPDYLNVWQDMIMAHDEFAQVPGLRKRIERVEQEWQKQLRKPFSTYEKYIRESWGDSGWAFLKIAKPDVINRLNQIVQEFNALTPEERAKKWFQYRGVMQVTVKNDIPYFVDIGGCRNCFVSKEMEEKHGHPFGGSDHEITSGCLTYGCHIYGHSLANPFFSPEEVLEKAIESKDPEVIENARKYILSVKAMYGSCYEDINVCLDSMIEELDAHASPSEEQT